MPAVNTILVQMCTTPRACRLVEGTRRRAAGFVVIVQDNYYGEKLSQMLDLLSPEEVKVFILCPSIEAIHEREESRNKVGYKGFSIQQRYKIFVETTPRLGKWIDNIDQSPEKTVRMILENL